MVDKIEMSLDDLIKSNKPRRRGEGAERRERGGKGSQRSKQQRNFRSSAGSGGVQKGRDRGGIARSYSRGDVNSAFKHYLFKESGPRKISAARSMAQASMGNTKLVISNLDFGVSDSDMQDLFTEFGPLRSANVNYDRSGRSLGTADVIFERRIDAIEAMKRYNGVNLDGKVMNIQLTTSEIPSSLRRSSGVGAGRKFLNRNPRGPGKAKNTRGRPAERERNPKNQRKPPTAEELDAELEIYNSKRNKIN
ncbi:hypothetical protein WA026_019240 [Henosepilachna vigintioctopunctata]|uniref:RRM domain-containing protein n=1 Tax=Henosepilachna vigintioctopunctata TaxID=420089 RepID=A0AAW1V2G3_9CUCU